MFITWGWYKGICSINLDIPIISKNIITYDKNSIAKIKSKIRKTSGTFNFIKNLFIGEYKKYTNKAKIRGIKIAFNVFNTTPVSIIPSITVLHAIHFKYLSFVVSLISIIT